MRTLVIFFLLYLPLVNLAQKVDIVPIPAEYKAGTESFTLNSSFRIHFTGALTPRAEKGVKRFVSHLKTLTGIEFLTNQNDSMTGLEISFEREGKLYPGEDESYTLVVSKDKIRLRAVTDIGVLHGLNTLIQLLSAKDKLWIFQTCEIKDYPRFVWRGLMIDVCRHWMPMEVILRNLDAMALVKMNVLHLHLSEDQGFRIESLTLPLLHEKGSNGNYFTQSEIKEIISYASDRGIRVVPEFDVPGHSSAWFAGYPEIASAPGPYTIEDHFGVFNPTIDPTNPETYKLMKKLFREMASLFPDSCFHIGGDENNGKDWDNNPAIQEFKKKNGINSNHELQAYFNKQLQEILAEEGKYMAGWDEILDGNLPKSILIQSWRGKESMIDAAKKGFRSILSNGYYIDLSQPIAYHYLNDPLPQNSGLTPDQEKLILGGEATMWAELVSPENVDSRIWPRTAAIAERFWSPGSVTDIPDLYLRLEKLNPMLELFGSEHLSAQPEMLRRLCPLEKVDEWQTALQLLSPVQGYQRHSFRTYTTSTPLVRLVDIAVPDPLKSAQWNTKAAEFLKSRKTELGNELISQLKTWQVSLLSCLIIIQKNPLLAENETLIRNAVSVCAVGIESIELIINDKQPEKNWLEMKKNILAECSKPKNELDITICSAVLNLLTATENLK